MVFMNPSHPRWTEVMLEQLGGIVDLGAPGVQLDKCMPSRSSTISRRTV